MATADQKEKLIKKKPWKFCKVCQAEIKSPTGYCHEHYKGETFTASPYGLVNTHVNFRTLTGENR